mmetsp:Transcript_8484/g.27031  ORF Transcript_8484/g.27031 Transcript_8484/m.27031 type:complete len:200 (+) Transcript_8484:649-1248(+)
MTSFSRSQRRWAPHWTSCSRRSARASCRSSTSRRAASRRRRMPRYACSWASTAFLWAAASSSPRTPRGAPRPSSRPSRTTRTPRSWRRSRRTSARPWWASTWMSWPCVGPRARAGTWSPPPKRPRRRPRPGAVAAGRAERHVAAPLVLPSLQRALTRWRRCSAHACTHACLPACLRACALARMHACLFCRRPKHPCSHA